jgi:hypothetical protein
MPLCYNTHATILEEKFFSDIVEATSLKRCQDPRDNFYALYTVFWTLGLLMPKPNYDIPVFDLYSQMSQLIGLAEQRFGVSVDPMSGQVSFKLDFPPSFSTPVLETSTTSTDRQQSRSTNGKISVNSELPELSIQVLQIPLLSHHARAKDEVWRGFRVWDGLAAFEGTHITPSMTGSNFVSTNPVMRTNGHSANG